MGAADPKLIKGLLLTGSTFELFGRCGGAPAGVHGGLVSVPVQQCTSLTCISVGHFTQKYRLLDNLASLEGMTDEIVLRLAVPQL